MKGAFSRKRSTDSTFFLPSVKLPGHFQEAIIMPSIYLAIVAYFAPAFPCRKTPTQTAALAGTPPKWLLPLFTQRAVLVGTRIPQSTAALLHLIASLSQDWWPSRVTLALGKEEVACCSSYHKAP